MWQKTHRKLWYFHKGNTRKMWTCWNKCSKGPQRGFEDTCQVRRAGTLQPEEEKAQGVLLNVCIYLVEMSEEDKARLFSVVWDKRQNEIQRISLEEKKDLQ